MKLTKTNFKTFLKKTPINSLLINIKSSFDGMVDGIQSCKGGFKQAEKSTQFAENTFGIDGIWLVGGGRDYFEQFNENGLSGIQVSNSCGSFIVARKES